jgi:hypothetical protein
LFLESSHLRLYASSERAFLQSGNLALFERELPKV